MLSSTFGAESGGLSGKAASSDASWSCKQCTFLNHEALSTCEMCAAINPGGSMTETPSLSPSTQFTPSMSGNVFSSEGWKAGVGAAPNQGLSFGAFSGTVAANDKTTGNVFSSAKSPSLTGNAFSTIKSASVFPVAKSPFGLSAVNSQFSFPVTKSPFNFSAANSQISSLATKSSPVQFGASPSTDPLVNSSSVHLLNHHKLQLEKMQKEVQEKINELQGTKGKEVSHSSGVSPSLGLSSLGSLKDGPVLGLPSSLHSPSFGTLAHPGKTGVGEAFTFKADLAGFNASTPSSPFDKKHGIGGSGPAPAFGGPVPASQKGQSLNKSSQLVLAGGASVTITDLKIDIPFFMNDIQPPQSEFQFVSMAEVGSTGLRRLGSDSRRVECGETTLYQKDFEELADLHEEAGMPVAGVNGLRNTSYYKDKKADVSHSANDLKRIMQEMKSLREKIEINALQAIFVRFDEDHPQFSRAIITGAEGTPYASGIFVFDIYIPPSYPTVPCEVVHITKDATMVTANNGPGGFSPNLHKDTGKVCLSLLGTFDGPGWDPNKSSLYQVLSTIQLMILGADHPFFMEPGYGGWEGKVPALEKCKDKQRVVEYDEEVKFYNAQLCILNPLKCQIPFFEKIILSHLRSKRRLILAALDGWKLKGSPKLVSRISPVVSEIRTTFESMMTVEEIRSECSEYYSKLCFVRERIMQLENQRDLCDPDASAEMIAYVTELNKQLSIGKKLLEEESRAFKESKKRFKDRSAAFSSGMAPGKISRQPFYFYTKIYFRALVLVYAVLIYNCICL
jgi:ubiquitin-protein ligase